MKRKEKNVFFLLFSFHEKKSGIFFFSFHERRRKKFRVMKKDEEKKFWKKYEENEENNFWKKKYEERRRKKFQKKKVRKSMKNDEVTEKKYEKRRINWKKILTKIFMNILGKLCDFSSNLIKIRIFVKIWDFCQKCFKFRKTSHFWCSFKVHLLFYSVVKATTF